MRDLTAEELYNHIGSEIGRSSWVEVTQTMIDTFAEVTNDHQFIHVDPGRAKAETPFGGTIAHGFLTVSLLSGLGYEVLPKVKGTAMGINYGFDKLRFLNPVRAGARICARFSMKSCEQRSPGELTSIYNVEVEIEGESKPALAAEWITRSYFNQTD